jgi:hypothetical protein
MKFIEWIVRRILDILRKKKRPSTLTHFIARQTDMGQVTLAWQYPTPATDQRAIAGAQVYSRVKGATTFDKLGAVVPFPTATLIDDNVADGDWEYQATTVDAAGKESAPSFAAIAVATTPPPLRDPSPLLGFNATQTG